MQRRKVKASEESAEKSKSGFGAIFSRKGSKEPFDAKALHDRIQQATESLSTEKVEKGRKRDYIEVPDDDSPSLNITESECTARYGQVSCLQARTFMS